MTTTKMKPRVTSLAPQFLVDDLARSIAYYQKLGFTFGEPWDGFYAIGQLDGLELHLKEAPKNADERRHRRANEHLDAAAGVDGIEAFYAQCAANGATITKPLTATRWGTKDFYVEDPDGYIVCFGGSPGRSRSVPKPKIGRMGYNPANFAHHIGTGPWVRGYVVYYAISFYDARTERESSRSEWWGPKADPKQLYGGFGLVRIPVDCTGQATARRIWRRFEGAAERLIHEIPDNVTTKYQDDVI